MEHEQEKLYRWAKFAVAQMLSRALQALSEDFAQKATIAKLAGRP